MQHMTKMDIVDAAAMLRQKAGQRCMVLTDQGNIVFCRQTKWHDIVVHENARTIAGLKLGRQTVATCGTKMSGMCTRGRRVEINQASALHRFGVVDEPVGASWMVWDGCQKVRPVVVIADLQTQRAR